MGRVDASQFLSALDRLDVFPLDGGLAALQTSEVRKLFVFFDDSGEASSASVEELLEFLLDNAVQTHCHRFAAIVARAARAAQRSGAAADADLVREVAAYLRRHDKKRDGSCRQAALEKTLHWTGHHPRAPASRGRGLARCAEVGTGDAKGRARRRLRFVSQTSFR